MSGRLVNLARRRRSRDEDLPVDVREQEVEALRQRLAALEDVGAAERLQRTEDEVQELRALGIRVAELADLVTELLAAAARRGDPDFARIVSSYTDEV